MFLIALSSLLLILVAGGVIWFRRAQMVLVAEDTVSVTVDRNGFIKRVLPAGPHLLRPFEKIDFRLEIKPRLVAHQAMAVVSGDGILLNINWSGVYAVKPDLITENISQRLRGLPNADKAIIRSVDIVLRRLIGDYTVQDMFKPAIRERIERQLSQVVAERLAPLGILLAGLNLQVIELPREVAEALNKAKAIEALDGALRQIDPVTREVVKGAYQLDEILHWDAYLPAPSRLAMKRIGTVAN